MTKQYEDALARILEDEGVDCPNCGLLAQKLEYDEDCQAIVKALQDKINGGWVKITSIDDLPQKKTNDYEQYDCIVMRNGYAEHLVWNCEHLVFDDSSGDDYECDWSEISAYQLFPQPPKGELNND